MTVPRSGPAPLPLDAGVVPDPDCVDARDFVQHLYRQHAGRLHRQLTPRTGCREIARELVQETFARLLRMPTAMLFAIERPDAYLRQVANNLLRDWARSASLARRARAGLEQDDHRLDQVAVLESRDTLRRLELAMEKLKPKTRAIFLAHRIEGLSYAEIAGRTGLSVKGVEKQMSKAIAKIDRYLERS